MFNIVLYGGLELTNSLLNSKLNSWSHGILKLHIIALHLVVKIEAPKDYYDFPGL